MLRSDLIKQIASDFKKLPSVEAIVLSGSSTFSKDFLSDMDFYLYISSEIDPKIRKKIAEQYADRMEINNQLWETGDEWIERVGGETIDLIYRDTKWIENHLNHLLNKNMASLGYTTCIWHNVLTSKLLFEKNKWFTNLQKTFNIPYPSTLKKAIIKKNYAVLEPNISSYVVQIEKAIKRNDIVSVNHRLTAFLASYFDILFAINEMPHPGEKRIIEFIKTNCSSIPTNFEDLIEKLLCDMGKNNPGIIEILNILFQNLTDILRGENLLS